MKIYTRTGDAGDTGLLGGARVSKAELRVDAYGEVDELNAILGVVIASGIDANTAAVLLQVQRDLFALGTQLADPDGRVSSRIDKARIDDARVQQLERWIDEVDQVLPPLREFVLPGGCPAAALLHLARAACRRAERRIVALGSARVGPVQLAYINRLSDLLFVLARDVNRKTGVSEAVW